MAKAKSLGRGLGELLGEIEEAYDHEIPKNAQVVEVPLSQIRPNPFQPRKHFDEKALSELAASIKSHGLIQPIVLVEDVDGYILVAGERRWRASKLAKLKTIRAVIASLDEAQMRQHALIENIQREQLNVVELAQAYEELINLHGLTQEELAAVVHKSRSHITNTLRLLQLSKKTLSSLIDSTISAGHAKVLVGLTDKEQKVMVDSIHGQKLSVRETEQMVKRLKSRGEHEVQEKPKAPEYDLGAVRNALADGGFTVASGTNKITITFRDEQEIARFLDILG
ncbi:MULTISPECIES: ParB/RepB/Spo0J family partition protein [Sulfurimonas]|uniref:ParB/RepB/Spo0J family partition protein n=1 Tax=Sulfurimonas diazotrophicus TaxID=3131939 RepID=A0ABZ3HBE3_9BACT